MDPRQVPLIDKYTDMFQIGARNMQNFDLLKEVGQMHKPVLLKRGMSATVKDLLMSAEYVLAEGNPNVVLCERGVRSFEDSTRNMLDMSAGPQRQGLSHLPIIVDPSHATGRPDLIPAMACASVAAGADGVHVEVHSCPEKALSDGPQALLPRNTRNSWSASRSWRRSWARRIDGISMRLPASWMPVVGDELAQPYFLDLEKSIEAERAACEVYPPSEQVFSALEHTDYAAVQVVILGQDPYTIAARHMAWPSPCRAASSRRRRWSTSSKSCKRT